MLDTDRPTQGEIEVTPAMIEAGVAALFASGLVQWNRPRLAVRGAVEDVPWAALNTSKERAKP